MQQNETMTMSLVKPCFEALDKKGVGTVDPQDIIQVFYASGYDEKNSRTRRLIQSLKQYQAPLDLASLSQLLEDQLSFYLRVFKNALVVPHFSEFTAFISQCYHQLKQNRNGKVASYIPELKTVDPDKLAISVCTVDGQQFRIGDTQELFCVQSMIKPLLYLLALQENGLERVHQHVGREPSGHNFNELMLNHRHVPHNPMINAGAIMCSSMIKRRSRSASRFKHVKSQLESLSGRQYVGFNNAVYHSEKETADRNYALSYLMREYKAFPKGTSLYNTLDLYFQACSIETNVDAFAVAAATLANAGVCPLTTESVFAPDLVKNCLSLMYSCGMYDYSGEWAFSIGLPAKSGVAGGIYVVIPDVMGICIWSPRLDKHGNSTRGIAFCKALVERYAIHNYDSVLKATTKNYLTETRYGQQCNEGYLLLEAAGRQDLGQMIRLCARGVDIDFVDYDGRSALHIAASEGAEEIIGYLLAKGAYAGMVDRWGQTPAQQAQANGHVQLSKQLQHSFEARAGA